MSSGELIRLYVREKPELSASGSIHASFSVIRFVVLSSSESEFVCWEDGPPGTRIMKSNIRYTCGRQQKFADVDVNNRSL